MDMITATLYMRLLPRLICKEPDLGKPLIGSYFYLFLFLGRCMYILCGKNLSFPLIGRLGNAKSTTTMPQWAVSGVVRGHTSSVHMS